MPVNPGDPFSSLIRVEETRGLDEALRIVDADELAESLREAGLDESQVRALQSGDVSLETYMQLVQLEVSCLREQGIEALDPTVSTGEYGILIPTYGFPSEVPGLTSEDLDRVQTTCQNDFTGAYQTLYVAKYTP